MKGPFSVKRIRKAAKKSPGRNQQRTKKESDGGGGGVNVPAVRSTETLIPTRDVVKLKKLFTKHNIHSVIEEVD